MSVINDCSFTPGMNKMNTPLCAIRRRIYLLAHRNLLWDILRLPSSHRAALGLHVNLTLCRAQGANQPPYEICCIQELVSLRTATWETTINTILQLLLELQYSYHETPCPVSTVPSIYIVYYRVKGLNQYIHAIVQTSC